MTILFLCWISLRKRVPHTENNGRHMAISILMPVLIFPLSQYCWPYDSSRNFMIDRNIEMGAKTLQNINFCQDCSKPLTKQTKSLTVLSDAGRATRTSVSINLPLTLRMKTLDFLFPASFLARQLKFPESETLIFWIINVSFCWDNNCMSSLYQAYDTEDGWLDLTTHSIVTFWPISDFVWLTIWTIGWLISKRNCENYITIRKTNI